MPYLIVEVAERACEQCCYFSRGKGAVRCELRYTVSDINTEKERPAACRDAQLRYPEYIHNDCDPPLACATHGRCWTHSK